LPEELCCVRSSPLPLHPILTRLPALFGAAAYVLIPFNIVKEKAKLEKEQQLKAAEAKLKEKQAASDIKSN